MKARKLLAVPLLAAALAISACNSGGGSGGGPDNQPTQQSITAQDVNIQDRANLQEGGELREAVGSLAENWNPLHVNGNEADFSSIRGALSPAYWDYDAKGVPTANPNFLTEATTNDGTPLVVTYKLNPAAKWNDDSPIDADDFIATWKACNGENKKFECVSTQGYDSLTDVKAGADKFEVVMTYKGAYPDWTSTFTTVLKTESVKDADTFNKGWSELKNDWFTGPFIVDKVDKTQQVVTELPNPKWWGDKPLLTKMTFRTISLDATAAAYVNNELDTFDIGPDPDAYARAKGVADGEIRAAAGPNFRQFTFNSKAGLVKDLTVRKAIVESLDRAAIGESDLAGIDWPAKPLNNHIFMENQEGYADSAEATGLNYNPDKAKSDLDAAGWVAGADGVREKDGKKLEVKFTQIAGVPVSENEALQAQKMLQEVGIKLTIVSVPTDKFGDALAGGEFEIMAFSWIGTPYPLNSIKQIYGTDQESNYAQLSMPEVDALIKQVDVETDPAKRIQLANDADKIIWENVHTLPLYQRPELIAVKAKLANYGAVGLSSLRYENIGYMKA